MLPSFFVLGASKAGTTTLHHWLARHPDVYVPAVKDTFFFNTPTAAQAVLRVGGRDDYESLFAGARRERAVGEVTATYLDDLTAPARISALIPDAKLIVSLREPVSRIHSTAVMEARYGRVDDVVEEAERLGDDQVFRYAPSVRAILAAFPPAQLHAFRFEDLVTRPDDTVAALCTFIGVDPRPAPDPDIAHNPGGLPRSKLVHQLTEWPALRALRAYLPGWGYDVLDRVRRLNHRPPAPLPEPLRASLRLRFRDDVRETQDLLGLDLSSWLQPV